MLSEGVCVFWSDASGHEPRHWLCEAEQLAEAILQLLAGSSSSGSGSALSRCHFALADCQRSRYFFSPDSTAPITVCVASVLVCIHVCMKHL